MTLFPRLAAVAALIVLGGCAYTYPNPVVEKDKGFVGAREVARQASGTPAVRMMFTHGMCSALWRENYIIDRYNRVLAAVGSSQHPLENIDTDPRLRTIFLERGGRQYEALKVFEDTIIGGDGTHYDTAFILWGKTVDAQRAALIYDNTRRDSLNPDAPKRAWGNFVLKSGLMNECLIDAVTYLGENGNDIRKAMRAYMCHYLGGKPRPDDSGAADTRLTCDAGVRRSNTSPLVLVPESLGSKILFDAFRDITYVSAGSVSTSAKARALGPLGGVHMVTNQVPLLDRGNPGQLRAAVALEAGQTCPVGTTPRADGTACQVIDTAPSLTGFLSAMQSATIRTANTDRVPVVAYTDPNDVLGYRIDDRIVRDGNLSGYDAVNVLLSNAPTFAGLISNPLQAHRGAEDREEIVEMIINGREIGR